MHALLHDAGAVVREILQPAMYLGERVAEGFRMTMDVDGLRYVGGHTLAAAHPAMSWSLPAPGY
jgi:hypothetical protein